MKLFSVGLGLLGLIGLSSEALAVVGRPLTPVSYAGAARRTVRRTATVRTAAALHTLPAGCAVGVPCGGVVYQPVYQGTTIIYVRQ